MFRKKKIQTDCLADDYSVAFLSGIYYSLDDSQKQEVALLFARGFRHLSPDGISLLKNCSDLLERVHSIDPNIIL